MAHRIALTPGEPAGIGPDLCVALAQRPPAGVELVAVADGGMLERRARRLGLPLSLRPFRPDAPAAPGAPGSLGLIPVGLAAPEEPGRLDPANADYVLDALALAADRVLEGALDALVTGPAHKGVINRAGRAFTGHTEFLARRCGRERAVMMLADGGLRVALATTHLPLAAVPAAITREGLEEVLAILHRDLAARFGIPRPAIAVCGLNPHAGEDGCLGREEIETIGPALEALRGRGMDLRGPLPADTAFVERRLEEVDAVLAMYHDQGLPVLKHRGFGRAVNITLGLPIIRTSVDHGTALDMAGRGGADGGSLERAVAAAAGMIRRADGP